VIKKLCRLAVKSYHFNEPKSRHLSAHVIRTCDQASHETVVAFANSLPDEELRDFEDFIQIYIPHLRFRNVTVSVPPFNVKGASLWRNRISEIANHARGDEWNKIRPLIFEELNKALLSAKGVDPTLRLVQSIVSLRGCDDFDRFLPGLVMAAGDDAGHIAESIVRDIIRSIPLKTVFDRLHGLFQSEFPALPLRVIQMETKIIANADVAACGESVSQIVNALKPVLRSSVPEVRRSAVLCFVQLYQKLGKEVMDHHLVTLSRSSQELILLYCAKLQIL
jgi:hypothetical protein